eukprot:3979224-Pyramimonas_sp.AAC.1
MPEAEGGSNGPDDTAQHDKTESGTEQHVKQHHQQQHEDSELAVTNDANMKAFAEEVAAWDTTLETMRGHVDAIK